MSQAKILDSQEGDPIGVCAIGASAGGLDPLESFFRSEPLDTGIAYVVIQHLSPDHESMMDSLLARHTAMPVRQAVDGMRLMPDQAYLIPPDRVLTVEGTTLHLSDRDRSASKSPSPHPIDTFFGSLAEQWGPGAAAVVLSGTGNDGSAGSEAVRRAGGLTLAQDGTAAFEGMPTAANQRGFVDAVASVPELVELVVDFFLTGQRPTSTTIDARYSTVEERIIADLVGTCGVNFSDYKRGTVRRRIEHRMNAVGADTIDDLADLVRANPAERSALANDILIGVTSFFRDPEVFEQLHESALERILSVAAAENRSARAWVVGCATGQEAYTIAMALIEAKEHFGIDVPIQIFATDVHEEALAKAAEGTYTESEVQNLGVERLHRFFREHSGGWRIREEIRAMVTFARHNMLTDTPFTRIDLTTCRNAMIYFTPTAQQRALWALGFALRHAGVLLLGTSESPGFLTPDFEPVVASSRIFVKTGDSAIKSFRRRMGADSVAVGGVDIAVPRSAGPDQALLKAYDKILDDSFAAGLLLDGRNEVLHVIGDARKWLEHASGRPSLDVNSIVRDPSLRLGISALLRDLKASETGESQRLVGQSEAEDGATGPAAPLVMTARQIRSGGSSYVLVSARPAEDRPEVYGELATMYGPEDLDRISHLESDLAYTRESLQAALEEQETSNEELNAANEELIASNEELQSSNEELSALNEELRTLNDEHHRRLQEVLELTADLEQILTSTQMGILLLNGDRTIRRFSDPARDFFHLMASDQGRPFDHIRARFDSEDFNDAVTAALESETSRTLRVDLMPGGEPVVVGVRSYGLAHGDLGVAITAMRLGEAASSPNESMLTQLNQTSPLLTMVFDEERRVVHSPQHEPEMAALKLCEFIQLRGGDPDAAELIFDEVDETGEHSTGVLDTANGRRAVFVWPFEADGRRFYGGVAARITYLQATMSSWVESQTVGVIADMLGVGAAVVNCNGTVGQRFNATLDNGDGEPLEHPENVLALSNIVASCAELEFNRIDQTVDMFVRGETRRVHVRGVRLGASDDSPYLTIVFDDHTT